MYLDMHYIVSKKIKTSERKYDSLLINLNINKVELIATRVVSRACDHPGTKIPRYKRIVRLWLDKEKFREAVRTRSFRYKIFTTIILPPYLKKTRHFGLPHCFYIS